MKTLPNQRCRLDLEKAIQAVGVILRQEGNTASRLRLLKLLYIAERRSIERSGRPLLGAKVVAMKNGPLHSELLDLIRGNHVGESRWASFFENRGIRVAIAAQPDVDLLSRCEIELLEEVVREFENLDEPDIVDLTHRFPEWLKHYPILKRTLPGLSRSRTSLQPSAAAQMRRQFSKRLTTTRHSMVSLLDCRSEHRRCLSDRAAGNGAR